MSKIPSHAECVFRGEIFDVYQWQQPMYDGSTATFERLARTNTVVVLPVLPNGSVCYAEQEQPDKAPYLSLFGGRAEAGEEPLVTGQRELLEETGYVADDWKLLFTHKVPGKIEWTIYYFAALGCRQVQQPVLDGGEKITVRTTTFEDFCRTIVSNPTFSEPELHARLYSAFNPQAAQTLLQQLQS